MAAETDKPVLHITQSKLAFVAALWFGFVQVKDMICAFMERDLRLGQVELKAAKIETLTESITTLSNAVTALKGDVQGARDLCYTQQQTQQLQLTEVQNTLRDLQTKIVKPVSP